MDAVFTIDDHAIPHGPHVSYNLIAVLTTYLTNTHVILFNPSLEHLSTVIASFTTLDWKVFSYYGAKFFGFKPKEFIHIKFPPQRTNYQMGAFIHKQKQLLIWRHQYVKPFGLSPTPVMLHKPTFYNSSYAFHMQKQDALGSSSVW